MKYSLLLRENLQSTSVQCLDINFQQKQDIPTTYLNNKNNNPEKIIHWLKE